MKKKKKEKKKRRRKLSKTRTPRPICFVRSLSPDSKSRTPPVQEEKSSGHVPLKNTRVAVYESVTCATHLQAFPRNGFIAPAETTAQPCNCVTRSPADEEFASRSSSSYRPEQQTYRYYHKSLGIIIIAIIIISRYIFIYVLPALPASRVCAVRFRVFGGSRGKKIIYILLLLLYLCVRPITIDHRIQSIL